MPCKANIPPITGESTCFPRSYSLQDKINLVQRLIQQIEQAKEINIGGVLIIADGSQVFEEAKSLILKRLKEDLESLGKIKSARVDLEDAERSNFKMTKQKSK